MTISKEKIIEIYKHEYANGVSSIKLAEKYGVRASYFIRWFHKLGLAVRSNTINSLLYSCNESYFETIDTQDKAYWLGFIYADGYITSKQKHSNRSVGISLSSIDINHLKKFKACVDGDMPIKSYETHNGYNMESNYCRIQIKSEKMVCDLIAHGVKEHKTNILEPPKLRNELSAHFIRGYYDGDGSIWMQTNKKGRNPQYSISFCGTDVVLQYIQEIMLEFGALSRSYPLNKRKPHQVVSNFKFGGNHNTLRFLNRLYLDSNVYLDRKHEIYKKLIHLVESRL